MAPRFSVLMPTHNRADVVGYAIRSVLWQTEPDFELLVVGDGCTDNTAEVVAAIEDSRIRWIDRPKAPHFGYANRNFALKQARGDLVAFAAHDDLLFPDHLAMLGAELEAAEAEWVYSRPLWVNADGIVVPLAVNLTNADELEYFLTRRNHIPASCVVHRRVCLEKYGYWPEDLSVGADWKLWARMIEGGGRTSLAYCRSPSVLHFRAVWKRSIAEGMPEVAAGLQIAGRAPWWPTEMKLVVPAGTTEQMTFFQALQSPGYVDRLRASVERVIERLAWNHLVQRRSVAASVAEATKLRAAVAELRDEVARLKASEARGSSRT
jgi:hypothetical protein